MGIAAAVTRRNLASGGSHGLHRGAFLAEQQDLCLANVEGCQAIRLRRFRQYGKPENSPIELDRAAHVLNVKRGFKDAVDFPHAGNSSDQSTLRQMGPLNPASLLRGSGAVW